MPGLADLAEARGDERAALDWLPRGYETSTSRATRAQWATIYAQGVIRLAPTDAADVEHGVDLALDELGTHPDSYHQRTRARLVDLAAALVAWSGSHDGANVLQHRRRASPVCVRRA